MNRLRIALVVAIAWPGLARLSPAVAETASKFSRVLAGKSIQCGAGSAMYFDPALRTASVIDGIDDTFSLAEFTTAIDPARIKIDDANRFDVVLTTREGQSRFSFERRDGVFLRAADGEGGDACTAADGRASYLQARADIIYEGVCGNDPKSSCEKALATRCGSQLTASCVRSLRPRR